MEEMQGRAVIVTGGASGIGRATALLLAREGAHVFIGDVDEAGGNAVAEAARGEGLAVEFLPLDLMPIRWRSRISPAAVHRVGAVSWTASSTARGGTESSRLWRTRRRCGNR